MGATRFGLVFCLLLISIFIYHPPSFASEKVAHIKSYRVPLDPELYLDTFNNLVYLNKTVPFDYKTGRVVLSGNPDGTGDIEFGEGMRISSAHSHFEYRSCPQKHMPPLDVTHMLVPWPYKNISYLQFSYIGEYCWNSAVKDGKRVPYVKFSPMYIVHFDDNDPAAPKPFLALPWSFGNNSATIKIIYDKDIKFDYKTPFLGENARWRRDVGIKYDALVLAVADGTARYVNTCASCGNAVYIDHDNGYQTRYFHLQKDGLINTNPNFNITVKRGYPIGKINYYNQTDDLYFLVVHDDNGDGNFDDDYPSGVVDPFARQSGYYLWTISHANSRQTVSTRGTDAIFNGGRIKIPKNFFGNDKMITIEQMLPPEMGSVKGIGFGVKATIDDGFGNVQKNFGKNLQVIFSLFWVDVAGYKSDSFGIYSSEDGVVWKKEDMIIDQRFNRAIINIDHLAYFALMGEQLDNLAPATESNFANGTLSLQASDKPSGGDQSGVDYTLYRIDKLEWEKYVDPVYFVPGKNYLVEYFSVDKNGNKENTKSTRINFYPYKVPLIFIPGFAGLELKTAEDVSWSNPDGHGGTYTHEYPADETVWVNSLQAIFPGNDDYFDILRLKDDGQTGEANLTITGNMLDVYQAAVDYFEANGYVLNRDLFIFPYDWRKDVRLTTSSLDQKIESIKNQTGSKKVNIVAHSLGGLVSRSYILNPDRASKVQKLITLGTPQLGAVEMLKNLRYGGCLTNTEILNFLAENNICFGLARSEVSDLLRDMASGYDVIPSQKYYDLYNGEDNNHPMPFVDNRDIDGDQVTGQLDYMQLKTTLTNLKHNTSLFSQAESFHQSDNFLENPNGVSVTIIAGSGIPTLGQIIEDYAINFAGIKIPKTDMRYVNGDSTVPLYSASLTDGQRSLAGSTGIYYTKQKHGALFADGPAMNLVKNILLDDGILPDGVSRTPFKFSGTGLSVHSPVNIQVFDQDGRHTGLMSNGDVEIGIPGSLYETVDEAKFIFLPDNRVYNISFESTGEGSFDFKIRKFSNDTNTQTTLYNDIPLETRTLAQVILDTNMAQAPVLALDKDGDGVVDKSIYSADTVTATPIPAIATATPYSISPSPTQAIPTPTKIPTLTPTPSATILPTSIATPTQRITPTQTLTPTTTTTPTQLALVPTSRIKSPSVTREPSAVLGVSDDSQQKNDVKQEVSADKSKFNPIFVVGLLFTAFVAGIGIIFYRKFFE